MSEPDYSGVADTNVEHEAEHAEAVDAQMRRTSSAAALEPLTAHTAAAATTPGNTYAEAEADAVAARLRAVDLLLEDYVDRINALTQVLVDAELLPEFED